jgi:hypothetical protein
MSGLSRVPSKGSPFHRGSAVLGGVLLIVVGALVVEPWAPPAPPAAANASQAPATTAPDSPRATSLPTTVRRYVPEVFGPAPTDGVWTVHTPTDSTVVPQVGRPAGEDISSGPVVDLGPADALDVVMLSGPPDSDVHEMRLWWFEPGAAPVRMELDRPRSPWGATTAWPIALRGEDVTDDVVGAWQPGLYRLDLLVGPEPRVRMVMVTVGEPRAGGAVALLDPRAPEPFRLPVLDFLPDAASVWTYGGLLAGWARSSSRADCAVADIWQAPDPKDECWAIPIGRTSALGVNLRDERVDSIRMVQVDPLPASIDGRVDIGVDRRTGLAAAWAPSGSLADGIYAIHAEIAGGRSFHWYAEVGPDGRRTESINGLVAGLQR